MAKTYYHVTTAQNAKKILEKGLKPKIGPNSKIMDEESKAIYLCRRRDIPYWKVLLKRDTVLKVIVEDDYDFESYHYTDYDEWLSFKPIAAKNISIIDIKHTDKVMANVMTKIAITAVYGLSRMCELCARYYEGNAISSEYKKELYDEIHRNAIIEQTVLRNVDSDMMSKSAVRRYLKRMGDNGAFTICDLYKNEDKRLYEKLIGYGKDDLEDLRSSVYDLIITKLDGCLDVSTGGWTG